MVYLIHFEVPFKHAQHYIGYSKDQNYEARIEHHRKGTGSALMKAILKAGIQWKVVRTWPNEDGNFERKLKNRKNAKCLCPICIELKNKTI